MMFLQAALNHNERKNPRKIDAVLYWTSEGKKKVHLGTPFYCTIEELIRGTFKV